MSAPQFPAPDGESEPPAIAVPDACFPETGACAQVPDGLHCSHWWDGDQPCYACGFDGESNDDDEAAE